MGLYRTIKQLLIAFLLLLAAAAQAATTTHAGTTYVTAGGNQTVTATPAVNDLIVVVAACTGAVGFPTGVSDNQSGTYVQAGATYTTGSSNSNVQIWVRNSLVTSAVSTIYTATETGSSGGGLSVYRVSGMTKTGLNAIRSTGGQSSGAASAFPAPIMGLTPLTGNPMLTAVVNSTNPATMSPPTSFTEDQDVGYTVPTTGMQICHRDSGQTSQTFSWGSNSATAFGVIVVELDASSTPRSSKNFFMFFAAIWFRFKQLLLP